MAVTLALGTASNLQAQRAEQQVGKTYQKAASVEAIQAMKKGDRYVIVCKECETITFKEVADKKELDEFCHNGGSLHCASCKKQVTVKTVGPQPGASPGITKVTIVNEAGKECMFVVPLKD